MQSKPMRRLAAQRSRGARQQNKRRRRRCRKGRERGAATQFLFSKEEGKKKQLNNEIEKQSLRARPGLPATHAAPERVR